MQGCRKEPFRDGNDLMVSGYAYLLDIPLVVGKSVFESLYESINNETDHSDDYCYTNPERGIVRNDEHWFSPPLPYRYIRFDFKTVSFGSVPPEAGVDYFKGQKRIGYRLRS
jgi:hypothetical protein